VHSRAYLPGCVCDGLDHEAGVAVVDAGDGVAAAGRACGGGVTSMRGAVTGFRSE
jgi:hypothetical protein